MISFAYKRWMVTDRFCNEEYMGCIFDFLKKTLLKNKVNLKKGIFIITAEEDKKKDLKC